MANAASETVEIGVVCMLRRLSTADSDKMILLPKDVGDVPLSATVRNVAADLVTEAVASGRDIAPAQTLYVLIDGRVVEPARQDISMQELGVVAGSNLYITTPYLLYSSSLEHAVLKLPRPKPSGKQFLVFPSEMGCAHMEDVAAWLCSPRVAGFAKYKFDTSKCFKGSRDDGGKNILGKIANRLEKMAAAWPILGGPTMQERSCTKLNR